MNFDDTYSGLPNVWYRFETDKNRNVTLFANSDGFEHLALLFRDGSRWQDALATTLTTRLNLWDCPKGRS